MKYALIKNKIAISKDANVNKAFCDQIDKIKATMDKMKPYKNIRGKIKRKNLLALLSSRVLNTDGVTTDMKKIIKPIISE